MTRKDMLREEFEKTHGKSPEEFFGDDHEFSERDLEVALAIDRDRLTSVALLIESEEMMREIDEGHLSEESKEEIRSTKAKIRFNKKVEMARYGMQWTEIRDLFLSGQYDVLDENYNEDWDAKDLAKWEVKDNSSNSAEDDTSER